MECSQSSCRYRHICSGYITKSAIAHSAARGDLQGLSCTHHSTNEARQGRLGRTAHQTGRPFAAIEDAILGSSETLTRSISTHNHTSDHVKHSYDSDSLADSNQPVPENSEGMIHDKYNPPDNFQSTHKVSMLPPTDHPLEPQSATVHIDQQSPQAKNDLQYFTNPTTQPRSRGNSSQSYHSISLHSTGQHDHYPSCSQFHHSTTDLTPPSVLAGTVRIAFSPSSTAVRTQDGHTAYASPIPQRTPRTSSAAIHQFSHIKVTVMQSSHYPYTADLLSLDECRSVVPSHTLPAECGHITTPLAAP